MSTATPSWPVAAWLGRLGQPANGRPGSPNASRAYLSPACRQYATMVSRAGRVGQNRWVASESPQPGPAAGRSGLSIGRGGIHGPASQCFAPPLPGQEPIGAPVAPCPLADRLPETAVVGTPGKVRQLHTVTFPDAASRGRGLLEPKAANVPIRLYPCSGFHLYSSSTQDGSTLQSENLYT